MGRLTKSRRVSFLPDSRHFVPSDGKPGQIRPHKSGIINLKLEEFESMRLRDIEGLTQQECADIMGISRQTFQNIIANGRKKVTMALMNGKALDIRGGNYSFNFCRLKCRDCNKVYDIEYMKDKNICPSCNSPRIICEGRTEKCMDWCNE